MKDNSKTSQNQTKEKFGGTYANNRYVICFTHNIHIINTILNKVCIKEQANNKIAKTICTNVNISYNNMCRVNSTKNILLCISNKPSII